MAVAASQRGMGESWMLFRLQRETAVHKQLAGEDRLAILDALDPAQYVQFLARIYGFEAPVELALAMTPDLEAFIDVTGHTAVGALHNDLVELGVADPLQLPRCPSVFTFRHPREALGWLYALEHNTLQHGLIERQLRLRYPETLRAGGRYWQSHINLRSPGARLRELGAAMDAHAKSLGSGDQIIGAARSAFRLQHSWYDEVARPRRMRSEATCG